MKYNTQAVAALNPEYLGFIFYEKSPRYFSGKLPQLPEHIKKVGVFVDTPISELMLLTKRYQLAVCQLHGDESVTYLKELRKKIPAHVRLWKVFSVGPDFDFSSVTAFETAADAFLFDTKGIARGGNGVRFSWDRLQDYTLSKPIILSGGIGPNHVPEILDLLDSSLPLVAIDVNSRFETQPGYKDIQSLKNFQDALSRR
ncbi:phosphoribosylanthranilate isomerase [Altibacter sp. HG106]|uniref:phosphoribosylanthranilate isomerase n=1 Tax=Altibacter sp. HG106 TaxID=3023937 RepID=UPI00234FEB6F|nr:phosphoribosylanthranilate isomerase [Altibacter sp. HG106]MDC7996163.1 phosphoribosylanthranilate isomerase [Altibacter sp. HG106]